MFAIRIRIDHTPSDKPNKCKMCMSRVWYDPKILPGPAKNRKERAQVREREHEISNGVHRMDLHSVVVVVFVGCLLFHVLPRSVYGIFMVPTWHIAQRLGTLTYFIANKPQTTWCVQHVWWAMFTAVVIGYTKMMTGRRTESIRRCHFSFLLVCTQNFNFSFKKNPFSFGFAFDFDRFSNSIHIDSWDVLVGVTCTHFSLLSQTIFSFLLREKRKKTGVKMSCWHTFLRLHSINLFLFSFSPMNRFAHSTVPSRNRYFCVIFIDMVFHIWLLLCVPVHANYYGDGHSLVDRTRCEWSNEKMKRKRKNRDRNASNPKLNWMRKKEDD